MNNVKNKIAILSATLLSATVFSAPSWAGAAFLLGGGSSQTSGGLVTPNVSGGAIIVSCVAYQTQGTGCTTTSGQTCINGIGVPTIFIKDGPTGTLHEASASDGLEVTVAGAKPAAWGGPNSDYQCIKIPNFNYNNADQFAQEGAIDKVLNAMLTNVYVINPATGQQVQCSSASNDDSPTMNCETYDTDYH